MINKVLSAGITLAFLAVVRPDPDASKIGIAFTGILMYEVLALCIGHIRKERKKDRYIQSTTISRADIKRWSDEWIRWPMKEVL